MAIFEFGGGEDGIAEYLIFGQKSGRHYARNELDERMVLSGDLAVTDAVITTMDRDPGVERYNHITLSFKEDYIPPETLAAINEECKEFFLAAYPEGEVDFYSEAHLPKIKSYIDKQGKDVDRLTHIHIVIPTINLVTGERASPLELLAAKYGSKHSTAEYTDAFQEYLNGKYGLASPKDNRRVPSGQSVRLGRDKTGARSDFAKRTESVPVEIMQAVIAENVTSMEAFEKLLSRYGTVSTAVSKGKTYFKIKQPGDTKNIRLNDPIFDEAFIELATEKKQAHFERTGDARYLEPTGKSVNMFRQRACLEMLTDWKEIRSREIRYISPSSKFFKERYRFMSRDEKKLVLDKLAAGEVYSDNEFVVAPTSSRLNKITAAQVEEKLKDGRKIMEGDAEAIRDMLDGLTHHQSSFVKSDLERYLLERTADPDDYDKALESVIRSPELVLLDGEAERYTSRKIHELERQIIETTQSLKSLGGKAVDLSGADTKTMNAGQKAALEALCSGDRICIVNGAAGTGKSYVLARMREAYEKAGYELHGAILQGKTAQDLERDSGIKSGTLHSFISKVESGKLKLHNKSVIVIDEAGMVGSEQMAKVLAYAKKYGARLRMVGDVKQVQAVSYGDAFATISQETGVTSLTQIMRQKVAWQNAASSDFSRHDIKEGLDTYIAQGNVHIDKDQSDAIDALVQRVKSDRPQGGSVIVVCKTNAERRDLNRLIRDDLIAEGHVAGKSATLKDTQGRQVELAAGDRVMFTAPNYELRAKNGTMGTVLRAEQGNVHIDVDGRVVCIENGTAVDLDYGYAVTVNKSQGMTVDRAYILGHRSMTANDIYVAMTRHRSDARLFASKEQFAKPGDEVDPSHEQVFGEMARRFSQRAIKEFTGDKEEKIVDGNIVDRLIREQNMEAVIEKEASTTSVRKLKLEIDLTRLLIKLEADKGLNFVKYEVIKEKNVIRCGSRELDAIDFMTREMHMDYQAEAMPLLRQTHQEQLRGVYIERRAPATIRERREFAQWITRRDADYSSAMTQMVQESRAAKSQARESGDAEQLEAIQIRLDAAKAELRRNRDKPNRELFEEFRAKQSKVVDVQSTEKGNENEQEQQQRKSNANQQNIARNRRRAPPTAGGRVREMSAINVVHHVRAGQMLLPRDVQLHLDDDRAAGDHMLRWNDGREGGLIKDKDEPRMR